MRTPGYAKKVKNVTNDVIDRKRGMIYISDQKISKLALRRDIKDLKRVRREAKKNKGHSKKTKAEEEEEARSQECKMKVSESDDPSDIHQLNQRSP